MKIYAAYGSNMNLDQMKKRCPEAKIIGMGILEDYQLNFKGKGHLNIDSSNGEKISIVLWEIDSKCESNLDIYEGFPDYYYKREIDVKFRDEKIRAMVYIMNKEFGEIIKKPTDEYYKTVYKGFVDNNIEVGRLEEALARAII